MRTARESALAFVNALKSTPAARAQSRLLNTASRDLAALLFHLEEHEREAVYAIVSPVKAADIQAELGRMRHVRLGPETVAAIAEHLIEHLSSDRPLPPASRYFRPRRSE
jgi:hypothetical protein